MISVVRFAFAAVFLGCPILGAERPSTVLVGAARIDITPETPIRLSGYGNRQTETEKIEQRLFARALAMGSDREKPVVLITVEVVGIPESLSDAVAAALQKTHPVERARVAVAVTHTHTGPSIHGVLPYLFGQDLPAEELGRIERYTQTLTTKLVQVAAAALANRRPGRLGWAEGRAGFTGQRRVLKDGKWTGFGRDPDGPADYALPLMRVTDEQGNVRAVFLSYACHCTTLGGTDNFVHGDWAGDAAGRIENAHPGAVALVAIGCGADANPQPRGGLENVARHGKEIAAEVARLLGGALRPLGPVTAANYRRIELDLDHAVTRAEMKARHDSAPKASPRYSAAKFLQVLESGRPLPAKVPYPVQTWSFGGDLAMVFLAGEIVSDYSLRLRRELDATRLWVNGYSNAVPCYIASKRMFDQGGYEVDGSMDYYGWPTRLALGTEDRIISTVHSMVPKAFAPPRK